MCVMPAKPGTGTGQVLVPGLGQVCRTDGSPDDALYGSFRDQLVGAGLLVPMGVPGLFARGRDFERAIDAFDALVARTGAANQPEVLRFPPGRMTTNYLIALEDFFFVYPTKLREYQARYRGSFLHGGASPEEMILPLAVLTPRQPGR